eukprot:TRINITY_DN26986_c0_g1_i1.p1 TRINITY_DN26986_c0_g1~~TRINITY_DN26986_c0_g1_i1.p1  ORF type:complete len:342 (-),score=12.85 TRINITY_DN26986_c0_g1_i1:424-1449(-)
MGKYTVLIILSLLSIQLYAQNFCPLNYFEEKDQECLAYLEDCDISCRTDSKIVGGVKANVTDWPYMVSIQRKNGGCGCKCYTHTCAGVLITPNLVLTAAHCFPRNTSDPKTGKLWVDLFVSHRPPCRHLASIANGERARIQRVHLHPKWSQANYTGDIAIAVLDTRFPSPYVQLQEDFLGVQDLQRITVAGWGTINMLEQDTAQKNLRNLYQTDVSQKKQSICNELLGLAGYSYDDIYDEKTMICGLNRTSSTCIGDSGGCGVLKGSEPENDVLVGLVSFGPQVNCSSRQAGQDPVIFTRVSAYSQWIIDTKRKEMIALSKSSTYGGSRTIQIEDVKPHKL